VVLLVRERGLGGKVEGKGRARRRSFIFGVISFVTQLFVIPYVVNFSYVNSRCLNTS